jgi:Uma2 family endonuclease
MEAAVQEILRSHKAIIYFEQLRDAVEDERRRREEFIDSLNEDSKAEFINGEVFVHSPVRLEHLRAVDNLTRLMGDYADERGLGEVFTEKALIVLTRNAYEPDLSFFGREKMKEFKVGQLRFPAPDLIVEVLSPSTEDHDRDVKFHDYAEHGVSEYWIIDADNQILEQYLLEGEEYVLKLKAGEGRVRSQALEGFVIPIRAIFDRQEKVAALRALLATPPQEASST